MAKIIDKIKGVFGGSATPENDERASRLLETLKKYTESKSTIDARVVENDRWYRSQHWDVFREQAGKTKNASEPEPVTAYLWNTLANRHGDLMDAYPQPTFTEREPDDKPEADMLSKIVKVVLERNKFRKRYSDNAWAKVKGGTSIYHVSWDQSLENGIGDISVKPADILRLYWEPGVSDIQDSKYLFALAMVDTETLRDRYPILSEKSVEGTHGIDMKEYNGADRNTLEGKTLVIDAYSKEIGENGKKILHLDKIVGSIIVESTRDKRPEGLYDHGKYPFVFDVLFMEEHSVMGFGFVDIIKSPQLYVDKLDQIILRNALVSGKQRVLYKDGGGINAEELADVSKDFIACTGGIREGEDYALLQGKPLGSDIMTHRQSKISELKEVSGANDFNRGSSTGGVTAASAIMALQEAGNKLARAMIANTYDAYTEICYQVIELIAQFYDEPRKFRITNDNGQDEYVDYTNAGLKPQPLPQVVEGVPAETRKPIFDIVVNAEKYSPYAAFALNEMAKEMFAAGFFQPEMAPAALTAMELMSFEGKERIVKTIKQRYEETMAQQQAQTQAQQELATNQEIVVQMNELIKQLTGKDMLAGANIGGGQGGGQMQ